MNRVARGSSEPVARPEGAPAPGGPPGREWRQRALATFVWVAPSLFLVTMGWRRRWVSEDAFIDFRVIEHLVAGHGPVYNLGERVEAYTNPLWLALLTGLALLVSPFAGPGPAAAGAAGAAAGDLPWGTVPLEWIAVFAGLATAGAGLLAAELGALRLARRLGATGLALPLGAVVFVAVPAAWDYVTSGLETGLILSWLGLTFWVLAAGGAARHPYACAFLVGLGPLIRPDLAIFGAAFLLILLAGAGWRPPVWAGILLAGAAAPVAYQVFRMGYFGVLVPNTALAKEAGMTYWPQGWRYLRDFVSPYALWLPLVLCLLLGLVLLGRALGRGDGARRAVLPLLVLPPAAALLHALYVVRVGGDFMHGRMLLPTLFALLLPLIVVAGHRWWLPLLPLGVVLPWAIVAALWLRPPYFNAGPDPPESVGREGIADERGFYVRFSLHPHPVTLADYEAASWAQDGHALRHLATQERG